MQPTPAHIDFWQWFQNNGDRLRDLAFGEDSEARAQAMEELSDALSEAEEGIILEFGPGPEDAPRQLVASADGKLDRVDAVKDFVTTAPEMPGWEVVAFRPRMPVGENMGISLGGESISAEDIWFRVQPDEDGLELTLFVRGLTSENIRTRGLGASLLAEHAIGELDAVTMLGSLDVESLPEDPVAADLRPFSELVQVLDEEKERKYPPAGSLPLDPEGNWTGLSGTIDGSSAIVLLNVDLRDVAGHPEYDHRLTVLIPFHQTRDDGMPATEEEFNIIQQLNDRISELLQEDQQSLLGLTIMTRGRREMIFYTSNPGGALARIETIRAEGLTHQIETDLERDTFWRAHRSFCAAADQDEEQEE